MNRPKKITFAEMRDMGMRGVVVYCQDHKRSHSHLSADRWPDDLRLSNIEQQFVCKACGKRGADVRPNSNWNTQPEKAMRASKRRRLFSGYCSNGPKTPPTR